MSHSTESFYFKIIVKVTPENTEWVSNTMFDRGATGIQEVDDQLWAFFNAADSAQALEQSIGQALNELKERLKISVDTKLTSEKVPFKDWSAEWKKGLLPFSVGRYLLIKPSWCEIKDTASRYVLEIDPEMAFGSGTHATTQLMLEGLEKYILPGQRVLDVGCGTGILSIAALKLGARSVIAFDIDPVAAHTTRTNAQKNKIDSGLTVFTGSLDTLSETAFDMIMANVNRSQLVPLLSRFSDCLERDGVCLLSGILDTERTRFNQACVDNGLDIHDIMQRDEWLAFEATVAL